MEDGKSLYRADIIFPDNLILTYGLVENAVIYYLTWEIPPGEWQL